jgi:hypothetical protein
VRKATTPWNKGDVIGCGFDTGRGAFGAPSMTWRVTFFARAQATFSGR